MFRIKKTRIVPFSCEQMFMLVNDVEKYNEFLPYCSKSLVHYQNNNELKATLVISVLGQQRSFTTYNYLFLNKMIVISLISGPFSYLRGFWFFNKKKSINCEVSFILNCKIVESKIKYFPIQFVLYKISNKIVDAFYKRAKDLYVKY
ncbi:type II toxin-antitoxin system RatA family toxin [Candidatus Legionella polyplacis]|uniref:Type II toxin-antitoxin system RatA family toxin n=1 Tax=Candidatus Legionella polyplacis TaxID=2005262 RepID=A0ABZ2GYV9_9GAMM|nr:type II toxin-antitoxin system RatA family toxin [Candidatus Legionella polyplacis]